MAEIRKYPVIRHLRSDPTMHALHYRRGELVRSGRGLAFWFRPLASGVAEVPVDDRELPYLFRGRSADFQELTVQGTMTYRVTEPETLADRIDFAVDLDSGRWARTPLEQVAGLMTQLAQQFVWDYLTSTQLREILTDGVDQIRTRIREGLEGEAAVTDLGLEVAAVRVAAIQPEAEVERALQTPTRETIQQRADQATFERRALAVEKERAIAENELDNRIELTRREEALVAQEGQNGRQRAAEASAAQRIEAEGEADRLRLTAAARAEELEQVEGARVAAERERTGIYRDIEPAIVMALAANQLAGKLRTIEHLNISPDMLTPLLATLAKAGTRRLDEPKKG